MKLIALFGVAALAGYFGFDTDGQAIAGPRLSGPAKLVFVMFLIIIFLVVYLQPAIEKVPAESDKLDTEGGENNA